MPWDGTELWVGDLAEDGSLQNAQHVAGSVDESIFQPEWSPDGILHFVSDRTGWWNLYRWRGGKVEALAPLEAEFGVPAWVFGGPTYAFDSAGRIICSYRQEARWRLAALDTTTLALTPIDTPYTEIGDVVAGNGQVFFGAAAPTEPAALVGLDLEHPGNRGPAEVERCHAGCRLPVDRAAD